MPKYYEFPCGCRLPLLEEETPEGALPLVDIDVERAPEDCPATWQLLGQGLTKGVFQLESPLGRQWTKKLKPENLEHIGALGAILRPGCLRAVDEDNVSMTAHYALRKNGQEPVATYHPAVDPILAPTYGVLCYQEQAMAIAVAVAGFNEQEADALRKAIGKKLPEEMAKCKKMFLEGAKAVGKVTDEQAAEIFGWIEKSQRYSFNKSHSTCYGVTGYHCAYIKAHSPLAFFTGWLANAKNKQDPQQEVYELVNEARLFDIKVEPPDLLSMEPDYHTDRFVIKAGLSNVKGVGDAQVLKLAEAAKAAEADLGKPMKDWTWYETLVWYSDRVSSSVLQSLIRVGALRWLNKQRCDLEAELKAWLELTDKEREWVRGQGAAAFDGSLVTALRTLALPKKSGPKKVSERVPKKGREEEVARLEAEFNELCEIEDRASNGAYEAGIEPCYESLEELEKLIKANRAAFTAATKNVSVEIPGSGYDGPQGGCSNDKRRSTVSSLADLLERPLSARADTPLHIAYLEEELLGISLTCSRIDSCDTSAVNCTCKEFLAGRTGFMVVGVEIGEDLRVFKTKGGKTPGAKYGRFSVSDATCCIDAVAWPDTWKEFGGLLSTPGNMVILQVERDFKDPESSLMIVRKAWQATQQQ